MGNLPQQLPCCDGQDGEAPRAERLEQANAVSMSLAENSYTFKAQPAIESFNPAFEGGGVYQVVAPLSMQQESSFPPGAFVIEFDTGAGRAKIPFTRKPLGMTFDNKMPIVVNKTQPNGHASRLGVQIGWEIKAIGGADVTNKDFPACLKLIQYGATDLMNME